MSQLRKKITHSFNGLEQMSKEDREMEILRLTTQHRTLPSIHNLTKLKSLQLSIWGRESSLKYPNELTQVTDLSGYLGLYSLKSLQHLYVHCCKISDACVRVLVEDKCLKSWKVNAGFSCSDTSEGRTSSGSGNLKYVFPYEIHT